jgi:hypothetical protein
VAVFSCKKIDGLLLLLIIIIITTTIIIIAIPSGCTV